MIQRSFLYIDYREYNWKSEDEISIYYSMVAREADIIMGSREEFDLTEKLIQSGRTDEETAAAWHAYMRRSLLSNMV